MTFSSSMLYSLYFEGMLLAIVSQWERTDSDCWTSRMLVHTSVLGVNVSTLVYSHFVNSHFVNSHFVNSHLVNFPLCQFPLCQFPFGQCWQSGNWRNGNWQSGKLTKWEDLPSNNWKMWYCPYELEIHINYISTVQVKVIIQRSFKRWSTAMYFLLCLGGCDPASSWTAARSVRACSPLMTSTSW